MKYELESRTSKVGERGQVTIPKPFRIRYGVKPGQDVVFEEREDGLLIKKVERDDPLRALLGRVRRRMDVDRYIEQARGPGWCKDLDEA
ncbi:MAG: AbrB/MazE/SpoVT family DNA-binding domain-containing protein [Gemmatimonadales bacterium]